MRAIIMSLKPSYLVIPIGISQKLLRKIENFFKG
jgi:hypothetical protein